jgi:AGZA family xanthine/uracil permease-like MFS transporter
MALFNVMGSLQSLESAEAAGDRYETRSSLAANGCGSILAGLLGSPFSTTIYIGHPGWKGMGARIGYSALNGVVICMLCFTGTTTLILHVVPLEATLGILIWIGIVMAAQAFQESPKNHALAVAMGLIPALGAWAFLLIQTTLKATGTTWEEALPKFGNALYIDGVIALNQGFILSSMLLAAMTAFTIDRRLYAAATTAGIAAALSAFGLLHGWQLTNADIEAKFGWLAAPEFAAAYTIAAVILCVAGFLSSRGARRAVI